MHWPKQGIRTAVWGWGMNSRRQIFWKPGDIRFYTGIFTAGTEKLLVFLEVKYRKSEAGGHPLEAVDRRKQRRICKTAVYYCLHYGYGEYMPCRFDVIGILGEEIIHVEDAFPFQG